MVHSTSISFKDDAVERVFNHYPNEISKHLLRLRALVFEVAEELDLSDLEETLKWGEPSYLTRNGSTIRLAWRASYPSQYGLFFNCKSKLIDTFKEVYKDQFSFESNRAIIFNEGDKFDEQTIKHCLKVALMYHKVKHLPLLGL